jgi:hypothetical protein
MKDLDGMKWKSEMMSETEFATPENFTKFEPWKIEVARFQRDRCQNLWQNNSLIQSRLGAGTKSSLSFIAGLPNVCRRHNFLAAGICRHT